MTDFKPFRLDPEEVRLGGRKVALGALVLRAALLFGLVVGVIQVFKGQDVDPTLKLVLYVLLGVLGIVSTGNVIGDHGLSKGKKTPAPKPDEEA